MTTAGKTVNVGDHIPYVICDEASSASAAAAAAAGGSPGQPASGAGSVAARAFHPDEVKKANGALVVDVEWYLGQQVRVRKRAATRVCAPPVQGLVTPRCARQAHVEVLLSPA
jgi:hypothetical protein